MAPAAAALAEITLDDKYALEDGQIFLSGCCWSSDVVTSGRG